MALSCAGVMFLCGMALCLEQAPSVRVPAPITATTIKLFVFMRSSILKSSSGRFGLIRSFLNTSAKRGFLQTAAATLCSMEIEPLLPPQVEKSRNDKREKT